MGQNLEMVHKSNFLLKNKFFKYHLISSITTYIGMRMGKVGQYNTGENTLMFKSVFI